MRQEPGENRGCNCEFEPLSLAAEFAAYPFLVIVFSLTRQDVFRENAQ